MLRKWVACENDITPSEKCKTAFASMLSSLGDCGILDDESKCLLEQRSVSPPQCFHNRRTP
jgi:hypothetical protein